MAACFLCREKPVIVVDRPLCRKHFFDYFEDKVSRTIKQFELFDRSHRLAVAASGGKDSTTVLYLLKKLGYSVEALAVDEGIEGYRDSTLADLKSFCLDNSIPLKVVSFKGQFGFSLDELLEKSKFSACMACGVLRRYVLNKASRDYDRLVTGHNLDDEAQSIIMNMIKANAHLLARLGPKTGVVSSSMFTQRVKPLYFCSEKEVASFAFLKGFNIKFSECPNASGSFRAYVRDMLNQLESNTKGSKLGIAHSFLKLMPQLKAQPIMKDLVSCSDCGEPSSRQVCSACSVVKAALEAG